MHLIPTLGGGGAERQLTYLVDGSLALGIEPVVVYRLGGVNSSRITATGCNAHRLTERRSYDPRTLSELLNLAKEYRPDLIQTWLPQMDILGTIVGRILGIPVLVSERNTGQAYRQRKKAALRRFLGRFATAVVANSEQGIAQWESLPDKVVRVVIENAIPVTELEVFRRRRVELTGTNSAAPVLMYVGRLTRNKNIEALANVFADCLTMMTDSHAIIYGDGDLRSTVEEVARTQQVADRFSVRSYSDDVWSAMAHASVFVSLSQFEGQPNTVLEAAYIGVPLVLSDIPAHREAVGDDGAIFVPCHEKDTAVSAIVEILKQGSLVTDQQSSAFEIVRRRSVQQTAEKYRDLYHNILADRKVVRS